MKTASRWRGRGGGNLVWFFMLLLDGLGEAGRRRTAQMVQMKRCWWNGQTLATEVWGGSRKTQGMLGHPEANSHPWASAVVEGTSCRGAKRELEHGGRAARHELGSWRSPAAAETLNQCREPSGGTTLKLLCSQWPLGKEGQGDLVVSLPGHRSMNRGQGGWKWKENNGRRHFLSHSHIARSLGEFSNDWCYSNILFSIISLCRLIWVQISIWAWRQTS